MEYCCHVWSGVPIASWTVWISYKKRYVGFLVLNFLPLWNIWLILGIGAMNLCYFDKCSFELAALLPLIYSREMSASHSDAFHKSYIL